MPAARRSTSTSRWCTARAAFAAPWTAALSGSPGSAFSTGTCAGGIRTRPQCARSTASASRQRTRWCSTDLRSSQLARAFRAPSASVPPTTSNGTPMHTPARPCGWSCAAPSAPRARILAPAAPRRSDCARGRARARRSALCWRARAVPASLGAGDSSTPSARGTRALCCHVLRLPRPPRPRGVRARVRRA
jgi:hypothetical protein